MKFDLWTRLAVGQMVREHVKRKYGTQKAAGDAWGYSQVFVSRVISGDRMPTDKILEDAGIAMVPTLAGSQP